MSQFARISPTARYTGAVWRSAGLSPRALHPPAERGLAALLRAAAPLDRWLPVDSVLRARHYAIDALLTRAVVRHRISQVVELAAGRSARGWRFKQRFGDALTYIETDLPDMARSKQLLLQRAGLLSPGHHVMPVDATEAAGAHCLDAVFDRLDHTRGVALISEGLLNYLPLPAVTALWERAGTQMRGFAAGRYFSDVYLGEDNRDPLVRVFALGLGMLVRGRVAMHFDSAASLCQLASAHGWRHTDLWRPRDLDLEDGIARAPGTGRIRILEAVA